MSLWSGQKDRLKVLLLNRGVYVRKIAGVPIGASLVVDMRRLGLLPVNVIFDVGAHRGESAIEFNRIFPSSTVYCFEPEQENFLALKENIKPYVNLHSYDFALSAYSGKADIILNEDSQTHSLRNAYGKTYQARRQIVNVETLDNMMMKLDISAVDLLKIDVEGMEIEVLQGATRSLLAKSIRTIVLEATLDRTDQIHTQLTRLQEFLGGYDYFLTSIYDQVIWQNPTRLAYVNAMFAVSVGSGR